MKKSALIQLILLGEGDTLEFKRTITHADKIAKTIVSFANFKGGIILVGVADDGKIIGCNPAAELRNFHLAINYYCEPLIDFFIEELLVENYIVLKINIPESYLKPHFVLNNNGEKIPYIRINDQSTIASKTTLKAISFESKHKKKITNKHELEIVQFLQKNKRITAYQLSELLNFSIQRSEKMLFELSLDGILREHLHSKITFYTLS